MVLASTEVYNVAGLENCVCGLECVFVFTQASWQSFFLETPQWPFTIPTYESVLECNVLCFGEN